MIRHSCTFARNVVAKPHRLARVLAVATVGASITACSSAPDAAGGPDARFDMALEDHACDLATPKIVASVFDVSAKDLDQSNYAASQCDYEWEGDDASLSAEVAVKVFETADAAAENFDRVTKSMSAEAVSDAMSKIDASAKDSGQLDTEGKKNAADTASGALSGRIHFEKVEGVGRRARFEANDGTLYVLQDNLRLRLTAYKGPSMPLPDKINAKAISRATRDWQQETMPQRKQQAIRLAKAIVAAS